MNKHHVTFSSCNRPPVKPVKVVDLPRGLNLSESKLYLEKLKDSQKEAVQKKEGDGLLPSIRIDNYGKEEKILVLLPGCTDIDVSYHRGTINVSAVRTLLSGETVRYATGPLHINQKLVDTYLIDAVYSLGILYITLPYIQDKFDLTRRNWSFEKTKPQVDVNKTLLKIQVEDVNRFAEDQRELRRKVRDEVTPSSRFYVLVHPFRDDKYQKEFLLHIYTAGIISNEYRSTFPILSTKTIGNLPVYYTTDEDLSKFISIGREGVTNSIRKNEYISMLDALVARQTTVLYGDHKEYSRLIKNSTLPKMEELPIPEIVEDDEDTFGF